MAVHLYHVWYYTDRRCRRKEQLTSRFDGTATVRDWTPAVWDTYIAAKKFLERNPDAKTRTGRLIQGFGAEVRPCNGFGPGYPRCTMGQSEDHNPELWANGRKKGQQEG